MVGPKELGKRVARIREERRMSQQEVAARAHLSYQTLWRIERGTQGKPSVFTIGAIARVLGVTVDYLVGMYEDTESEHVPTVAALA
jgi:transcriptional regulator with XRE-family HTH domain